MITSTPIAAQGLHTACTVCGGLRCLCRPRFFAGQLLTEEDLNRLEHYIIEKNKLHNRYLYGWGVVCGLEVVCHPCDGFVTVKSGYALSPCGEDIVVCHDDMVNVCDMINRCDSGRPRWECEPMPVGGRRDCPDVPQEWLLTIRYDEKAARGITALRGASGAACCTRCSCGGSAACGCGCHDRTNGEMHHSYRPPQPKTPPQCEPTLTCEGYVYDVCPAPKSPARQQPDPGELVRRLLECVQAWSAAIPPLPQPPTFQNVQQWCHAVKANWLELLAAHDTHDCQLDDKLRQPCPTPDPNETPQLYQRRTLVHLASLVAEPFVSCVCSTLLPPCPESVTDPRVILATITVQKDKQHQCQIVRVCNWDRRRLVLTFPTLGYWLSVFGVVEKLHQIIAKVCCQPVQDANQKVGVVDTQAGLGTRRIALAREQLFTVLFAEALRHPERQVDAQTLFLGELGVADAQGRPYMTGVELDNPVEFLLVQQIAAPFLRDLLPTTGVDETTTLRSQLADMQQTLQQQQQQINALNERLSNQ